MWLEKKTDLDAMRHMKNYQTVISGFKTGNTDCKIISSVSPHWTTILWSPRIRVTATRVNNDQWIKSLKLQKFKLQKNDRITYPDESESITLTLNDVNFLASFLQFLQSEDIGDLKHWNFKNAIELSDFNNVNIDSLKNILNTWNINAEFINTIIEEWVTNRDVVWLSYRRKQLEVFHHLLNTPDYINTYKQTENELSDRATEEKVFQHFFQKNSRIFWYGLDYKYLSILQREATVWPANVWWTEQELLDFITSCNDYTVLVEIKKPSTSIFSAVQNRSWSWLLSSDFIWAISQVLEYKASAQLFLENPTNRIDSQWNQFDHYTLDPKSILIIGRREMLNWSSDLETRIKKRTFELYKRDSRNIDILTYDDLLDRARFIVGE